MKKEKINLTESIFKDLFGGIVKIIGTKAGKEIIKDPDIKRRLAIIKKEIKKLDNTISEKK